MATETGVASEVHDVIIIGAGPAGLSAALSLAREHFSVLVLEREAIGGNLLKIADLENYAGFKGSGAELSRTMKEQARKSGAVIDYGDVLDVSRATSSEPGTALTTSEIIVRDTDNTYWAKAAIIANGMKARDLEIKGLKAPVFTCATCDGPLYKDKKLAVIGGGDSAFQTAIFLASFAEHVSIVSRSAPRASEVLRKRVSQSSNVTVLDETMPTAELLDRELGVVAVFAEIGSDRNELPKIAPELMEAPNVLFAGDCRPGARRQVVSAAADGAEVAEKIRVFLTS
ncbi:FAD-dependent oxidoreductase [Candidatus Saccharibacteria bacterium]|nr:FAD-dependent oxidoreductase [Candidatus Saccharibacteria bacterium]